jgi:hypothetical protein
MENACAASDGQTAVTVNHGEWIYRYIIPDGDVAAVGFNADMGEDVCAIPDRYSAAWAVESVAKGEMLQFRPIVIPR